MSETENVSQARLWLRYAIEDFYASARSLEPKRAIRPMLSACRKRVGNPSPPGADSKSGTIQ